MSARDQDGATFGNYSQRYTIKETILDMLHAIIASNFTVSSIVRKLEHHRLQLISVVDRQIMARLASHPSLEKKVRVKGVFGNVVGLVRLPTIER